MSDITPTDTQAAVIKDIIGWYRGGRSTKQVYYLAGYAGTGKSTIAKFVIDALATSAGFNAVPAAYTGKAANVLRQKGNPSARTFHSGMYLPKQLDNGQVEFILDRNAPFSTADLILGDECSINEELGQHAESYGKKILIMGDPGQLKPVQGFGYWTEREPDAFLTEVHRQALDSPILRLATLARKRKKLPKGAWKDAAGNKVCVLEYEHEHAELMCREDTQAICGTHKHRKLFTQHIREERGFEGNLPRRGETLLCVKNDNELGIYNGCFGTLLSDAQQYRYSTDIMLDVKMEDLNHPLTKLRTSRSHFEAHFKDNAYIRSAKKIQEFDWGYVITCHKAQGSEWDDVTVLDDSMVFGADSANWLYTAITRASKQLTLLYRTPY